MKNHLFVAGLTVFAAPELSLAQDGSPSLNRPLSSASGVTIQPSSQAASASTAELLLSSIPGLPESMVPGIPGVVFDPGTGGGGFDRVYGSPNGNWIITGTVDLPFLEDEVLLVNGALVQHEGQPTVWTGGTENAGGIEQRCDVNDAGDYTYATNTDGPTSSDEYVVSNVGGTYSIIAMESAPVPALPGSNYGTVLGSPLILADGTTGFRADNISGVPIFEDEAMILGGTVLLQEGITVPSGQIGAEPVGNFDISDFWAAEDGSSWLVQGDLIGPTATDDVVIVDGTVVVQEGVSPNAALEPVISNGIGGVHMDSAGNWYARGSSEAIAPASERDWVLRNGDIIAAVESPITVGSTEIFDDDIFAPCFFLNVGNGVGDYIVGGVTDNADLLRNGVLVMNGTDVICRESDPIDLDGNGLFDDDAFVDLFGNDDAHLSDDGYFIFIVIVKDSMGVQRGMAVLKMDLGTGDIGMNYCMANANSSGAPAMMSALGSTDVGDNNVTLEASNLPINVFGFMVTSLDQGFFPNPGGSEGNLCVVNQIGRFVGPGQVQNSGATGTFSLAVDLTMIPQPTGAVSAMAGDSWNFQAWFRDTNMAGAPTSNFTDGIEIQFQ